MPLLKSWVESANTAETDFPLNNLPYGVFDTGDGSMPRCGVAIGDMIFDLCKAEGDGLIEVGGVPVFDVSRWNDFMELGPEAWDDLRRNLTELLAAGAAPQPHHLAAPSEVDHVIPLPLAEHANL